MSGTVDWGAVAKTAGAALNLGKGQPGYQIPVTHPADDYTVFDTTAYHSGAQPGGALYQQGVSLMGPLSMPKGVNAADTFTWEIQETPGSGQRRLTQMTLAGALSWLRNASVHDKKTYDEVVVGLVQAGYLDPSAARYGGYTTTVGTKFLQSAIDVEQTNNDSGNGGVVTSWWNHIDALIQGRKDAGQLNADGSTGSAGGSGSTGPVRQDSYTDPATVKASINNAAMSVLGRHLTDDEAAQFAGSFHSQESQWNSQSWAGQQAQAAGTTSTVTSQPSVSASAQNYVDDSPALAADRTKQLLGSYIGVLRNMTGLGSGGVSSAVS